MILTYFQGLNYLLEDIVKRPGFESFKRELVYMA